MDSGDGPDDLLVAFGSEGDVMVYKGIDPNSADTWALQGVYYAGSLLAGHRFHVKVSGDLKFLTTQGLVGMNTMFTSSQTVSPQNNVEYQMVQQFLAEQVTLYGFLPGWDLKYVPSINMLIVNVPSVTVDGSLQLCENVVNSKWTTFIGFDATTWVADYQDVPFFGDPDGRVLQGWVGNTDNVTVLDPLGTPITALVQQAYNYLGTPANNKQVGLYRPNFLIGRGLTYKTYISYDFGFKIPILNTHPVQEGDPLWDQAIWDLAVWSAALRPSKEWISAEGLGFAASFSMTSRADGEVLWVNTDMTSTSGGIL